MSKTKKHFLITGHPRCGTGYMAKLMQKYGYDIGHEEMGEDGISSWIFAAPEQQIWKDDSLHRNDFKFENTIGVVRDPVNAISSIVYTENTDPRSVKLRRKYIVDYIDSFDERDRGKVNAIEFAVISYIAWNEIVSKQSDWIVKLENANQRISNIFKKDKLNKDELPSPNTNARKHPATTIEQLKSFCSKELLDRLKTKANDLRYEVEI